MNSKNNIYPKLTLVGAGPGDPDLITIKGVEAIATADVILYDATVSRVLLDYAPADALKISVGERNNKPAYTKEQVNALIIDSAFSYGHVVRLTGSDPFISDNGHEELTHAELFNIPTAVVPGISVSASGKISAPVVSVAADVEKRPAVFTESVTDWKYLLN